MSGWRARRSGTCRFSIRQAGRLAGFPEASSRMDDGHAEARGGASPGAGTARSSRMAADWSAAPGRIAFGTGGRRMRGRRIPGAARTPGVRCDSVSWISALPDGQQLMSSRHGAPLGKGKGRRIDPAALVFVGKSAGRVIVGSRGRGARDPTECYATRSWLAATGATLIAGPTALSRKVVLKASAKKAAIRLFVRGLGRHGHHLGPWPYLGRPPPGGLL